MIYGVAILSCVCFLMLFHIRDYLMETRQIPRHELNFERTVGEILGKPGKIAVLAALIFTQAGFATAYVIFIADNLHAIYPNYTTGVFACIQIPFLILICWIRDLKWISPVAMCGILVNALAVVTVLIYCFGELSDNGIEEGTIGYFDIKTFPIAFGVAVYLFEGIGLILPLEVKMKKPEDFKAIMWGVHLLIATIVSSFGLIGYLTFFQCTVGPIIDNIPPDGILFLVTVWALNVALLFTYPIQMYPVFVIVEKALEDHLPSSLRLPTFFLIRAIIVLLSVGVGIGIPDFSLFLSLVGGFGSAQLMFIIPPIAYYVAFKDEISTLKKVGCATLLTFGVVTVILTTTSTLLCEFSDFCELDVDCSVGV
jgi:solute carrier family 36 (proton-coupled amino acid transporter)